jgi:hypothetical protein
MDSSSVSESAVSAENQLPMLVPTFHQVPYTTLVNRVDRGSQGLFEFTSLLNDRKELEEKQIYHFSKISRSQLFSYEIETSSSERLLGFFKNYHLFLQKEYMKYHKELTEIVLKNLEEFKVTRSSALNKSKVAITNKLRDVSLAEESLNASKKQFAKAKKDLEKSLDKLSNFYKVMMDTKEEQRKKTEAAALSSSTTKEKFMSRMFSAFESTPEQDYEKQQKKVEKRKDELNNSFDNILEKKKILLSLLETLDELFYHSSQSFEEFEIARMKKMNTVLQVFCKLERTTLEFRLEQLTLLEEAVSQQNFIEDIALFIESNKSNEFTHQYGSVLRLIDEYYQRNTDPSTAAVTGFSSNYSVVGTGSVTSFGGSNESEGGNRRSSHTSASINNLMENISSLVSPLKETSFDAEGVPLGEVSPHRTASQPALSEVTMSPNSPVKADESASDATMIRDNLLNSSFHTIEDISPRLVDELTRRLDGIFPLKRKNSGGESMLSISAIEDHPLVSVIEEEDWKNSFETKDCRDRFLQDLDYRRCHTSCISVLGYQSLRNAMKVSYPSSVCRSYSMLLTLTVGHVRLL